MKVIIMFALVAVAAAGIYRHDIPGGLNGSLGSRYAHHGRQLGGAGGAFGRSGLVDHHAIADYSTGYAIKDPYSGVDVDVQENRLGDRTEGSYSTQLPDGRKQVVTYWVDGNSGYNADVQYYGTAQHPQTPIYHGRGLTTDRTLGHGVARAIGVRGADFGAYH